jgi:hypothetical protein
MRLFKKRYGILITIRRRASAFSEKTPILVQPLDDQVIAGLLLLLLVAGVVFTVMIVFLWDQSALSRLARLGADVSNG